MALLGMGATVQCNGYLPGYYSTRDLIFESEGSTLTSSNVNSELKNDCRHIGSLPVSSSCNLLGYSKELLKQTILKHEAIFRDQIHELHRIYQKQRELMEEIKRSESYKHNLRLEASWSGSLLSSNNAQKICSSPNLPWSTGQSSVLIAESMKLPLACAQEKSRQMCSAPTVNKRSLKDSELSESKYRKIRKKILDLQLPADEYIDNEEGECLENERVTEVQGMSPYSLNGSSNVVCDSYEKPYGINSNGFAGLNVQFKLEEAASKSYDLGGPAHHRNSPFYDLSRTTKLDSRNLPNDVIWNLNKRQGLEACSDGPLPDQKKKHEQLSRVNSAGQFNNSPYFHSLHQVRQPWTERKFSSGESSAQTQGFTSNGLLGPSSASHTSAQYQLVSGDDINSGISPAGLWKTPVSDCGQSPIAVQALPFFNTSASLGQSSKSLMGISGFTQDEIYQYKNGKSGPNLDSQNFLLSSKSKLLNLPSISTNDPNSSDNRGSSDSQELRTYVKGSKDVATPKNLNLNITPAGYFDTTAFQSIQIPSKENKFQDSSRGFPWLKEKPVFKGKPSEGSKIPTQIESVLINSCNAVGIHGLELKKIEESDLSTGKTLALHCNGKPQMSSDLQPFHVVPSEVFQNQPKNQRIEETEKGCMSDAKSPCIHMPDLGKQIPAAEHMMKNEQKKHESVPGVIDLNSCITEDENMPMDVDFQAPTSPENKECSPPRGESDENQLETPFQLAGQEDPEVQEEQVTAAAEALVSISGFVAHNGLQMTTCSSSESFASNPLRWFAGIVSTAAYHPENETKAGFSGKANNLEEFSPDDMDYFEFMTLNLTETKVLDCCCKIIGQTEQVGESTSPTQPRKGRMNRGRWRKDFQSEILHSLASLSRYEVTEDLQTIGGLVAAGTPSETGSLTSAGKNLSARGRRRASTSTSNNTDLQLNLKQLTSITGLSIERGCLISWGKTCRKRRGQRLPTTNPQHILNQVYN